MKRYDVTVLGEALIDFTEAGFSTSGTRLFEQNPGGAVANVICALSRFGAKTAFIGKVGQDMHGSLLRNVLIDRGVDVSGMIMADDVFTTLSFVSINKESGEREFSFARKPGADTCLNEDELKHELLENTKIMHIGSLSMTDEPCRTATFTAIKRAKESGAIISYDPNYRASLWRSEKEAIMRMREPLPFIDIMKLSDEETELLTNNSDPEAAARELNKIGVTLVAVTLGKSGAIVCVGEKCRHVMGYEATAIDTTGAGDAFWGGFLYQLLKSDKPLDMVNLDDISKFARFGNATAAVCVSRRGGIPSMPTLEEVEKMINTTPE